VNEFDPSLDVRCRNTKGSTENVSTAESRKGRYRAVQARSFKRPSSGTAASQPAQDHHGDVFHCRMFVVRADSPYHTIRDLVGKPVAFGAAGRAW